MKLWVWSWDNEHINVIGISIILKTAGYGCSDVLNITAYVHVQEIMYIIK